MAADPTATAAQIITAGGPTSVATHGGVTLVSWSAESDTSEGPAQGAWRLYGRGGHRISDGTLGQVFEAAAVPDLVAVPDGFLVAGYPGHRLRHLSDDGTLTDVPTSRRRAPTRPGDVLVPRDPAADGLVYRPGRHLAFRLPALPSADVQGVAVDATGRVWAQQGWDDRAATVSSSADGTGPWTRTRVPLAAGGLPQSLDVLGSRVVVSTARSTRSFPALDALWTRPVAGPAAGPWRRVDTAGARLRDDQPVIGTLPDGRLVVSGANQQMYLQQAGGTFARLRPARGMRYSSLRSTGNGLYLVGSPDNRLYESRDGRAWEEVAR